MSFKSFFRESIFPKGVQLISCLIPKKKNLVIFGAFLGNRFGDNSGFFYLYCLRKKKGKFHYIWLSNEKNTVEYVKNLGGESYLKMSLKGLWSMLRSSIIITSHGTQDTLIYRPILGKPMQIFLSHGIPLRKQGLINKPGSLRDKKLYDDHAQDITYMVATSVWGAAQQQKNTPVSSEKYIITGYPRNDIFFDSTNSELQEFISRNGLSQYNILYATTWRKWEASRYFPFTDVDLDAISVFLRKNQINIILRPHSVDMPRQKGQPFWQLIKNYQDVIKVITIDQYRDTQKLLQISDCLITDYSSIYYDYLLLDRPIIFIPYDMNEYVKNTGGFNGDYEQLTPGPKPKTQLEFLKYLKMFKDGEDSYSKARNDLKNLVHKFQDGHSSGRVFDLIEKCLNN